MLKIFRNKNKEHKNNKTNHIANSNIDLDLSIKNNIWVDFNFELSGGNFSKSSEIIEEFVKIGAESNYIAGGIFVLFKRDDQKVKKGVVKVMDKYNLRVLNKKELTLMQEIDLYGLE